MSNQGGVNSFRRLLGGAFVAGVIFAALGLGSDRRYLFWLLGALGLLLALFALAPVIARTRLLSVRIPPGPALLIVTLFFSAALGELVVRRFFWQRFPDYFSSMYREGLDYRYDSKLGWFPIPNRRMKFYEKSVVNNSAGFRGEEYLRNEKPAIMFLGDSFVWGFGVEAADRFTDKLQAKHPEWNILNLGIVGYGTDQEFLLLQRYFEQYRPRIVFVVFCTENDDDDNSINLKDIYYKPYYTTNANGLALNGVPVPRSERVFCYDHPLLYRSYLVRLVVRAWTKVVNPPEKRNDCPTFAIFAAMQRYVAEHGALLAVGLTDGHPRLERFLQDSKIPCLNLATPLRFSEADVHWTPEGHSFVCSRIEQLIVKGKLFDSGRIGFVQWEGEDKP